MEENIKTMKLNYTIHKYSSFSAHYIPQNIMVNKPSDQLSRWFTDSFTPSQFIMLKLESPALVEVIKFGKYMKPHVSDLKKFQVYGGTDENNLSLLLTAGLRKDNSAETFRLRHVTQEGLHFPVQYLKIRKEEEAVRILLKHLRRRRYKDAFEALSRESGVKIEGPVQSRLWNALVENKDYKLAEKIFEEAANDGELEWYMSWQPYNPEWKKLCGCSSDVEDRLSSGDQTNSSVTNRNNDLICSDREPRLDPPTVHLDDLWRFDPETERWTLLCEHSEQHGGPSPRSCHKMVFDPVHQKLYTLGRYLDNAQRTPANLNDTALAGGPRLMFDHQLCLDPDTGTLYVFGGRVLPSDPDESAASQYSGLYAYYIQTDTWQQLLPDKHDLPAPQPRVSHSMLFHPVSNSMRNKEQLLDIWWWDVDSGRCGAICPGVTPAPPPAATPLTPAPPPAATPLTPAPAAGFTQRATIDPDTDEIFVLSIHYLFGGNPGSAGSPRLRLDDLWSLRLQRPSSAGVVANFQKLATLLFSGEKSEERSPVSLSPRRTRTLAARRARAPLQADHVRVLAQVLGIDDSTPEPTQPFEECLPPTPDTWDVGHDAEDHTADPHWDSRQSRIQLYDRLAHYYKPSTVPPQGDIMDLVTL
ncbi:unnamed protein product [Leptidea sinapis]|uniref:Muskelin N-terminal domain-containing protein n=1 Tax=Leptidea sinapis TaxID=189913 RepID=A0A5E4R6J4_9NEOP|nr:unnamed protein product [Leptidea sinapis]